MREGWFEKSRAGFFALSPRALIELKHYLLSTYNHPPEEEAEDEAESRRYEQIKLCAACKDIVTMVSGSIKMAVLFRVAVLSSLIPTGLDWGVFLKKKGSTLSKSGVLDSLA